MIQVHFPLKWFFFNEKWENLLMSLSQVDAVPTSCFSSREGLSGQMAGFPYSDFFEKNFAFQSRNLDFY